LSQKDGDQALLDWPARPARDGRITWNRLTCRGLNAANRLIKNDRANTGERAGNRWELVLTPAGDSPGARS
jgi:hypothetical protein